MAAMSDMSTLLNTMNPPLSTNMALGMPLKFSSGRLVSLDVLPTDGIEDEEQSNMQFASGVLRYVQEQMQQHSTAGCNVCKVA